MTRLRPGVRATLLPRGVHVRAWTTSFTVEGGTGVPELWRRLAEALRCGEVDGLLAVSGPQVRRGLTTLLDALDEHGMLMPSGSPGAGGWLDAVAPDPVGGARAVGASHVVVYGSSMGDRIVESVCRALSRSGAVVVARQADEPFGQVVLETSDHAVALRVVGGVGFATEPMSPGLVRADARALAGRLGLAASESEELPGPMSALLAGAAVQRLVCAVAGLPDPATVGENPRLPVGWPSVLVASADPLHAEYHPWRGRPLPVPTTLSDALRTVEALCDDRTGSLPAASPGSLPQLPAALAACEASGVKLIATAPRVDLARLEATCRAAELQSTGTVGLDYDHAAGRALRTLALSLNGGDVVPLDQWEPDRQAQHWWRVLAVRLGISARASVFRIADGVFHAEIHTDQPADAIIGSAVEATPADAVAFAALGAVGLVQARRAVHTPFLHVAPTGAFAVSGLAVAAWEAPGSTAVWLRDVADRQAGFRDALSRLVGPVRRRKPDLDTFPWAEALTVVEPVGTEA